MSDAATTAPVIRVIDFETTGMDEGAEVVEAAFCDLTKVGDVWIVGEPVSWLCWVPAVPPEVRAVHHIRQSDTEGCAPFASADLRSDSVSIFAAHNAAFELQFFEPLAPMLCTLKAALRIWPDAPSHSNGALRYWLEDQGAFELNDDIAMPAHRAGPDTYVTAFILRELLKVATASQMVRWTKEPRLLPRCTIGKFRGKPWPEVEAGFLAWMCNQPDMDADLKWNARRELDRRRA